jgi:hypothetical protein
VTALSAAALSSLADWIGDQLGNEHAARQTICEDVAAQLRDMAAAVRESREDGGDYRIQAAREYLDGARKRRVTELPPSLLERECAELRRTAGQLLDVITEQASALQEARAALLSSAASLDDGQAATVLDALGFAAEYRRYRASLTCEACAQHPAELCEDHAADLDRAEEYDQLAGQIGGAR